MHHYALEDKLLTNERQRNSTYIY